jgi:hypothetical protein
MFPEVAHLPAEPVRFPIQECCRGVPVHFRAALACFQEGPVCSLANRESFQAIPARHRDFVVAHPAHSAVFPAESATHRAELLPLDYPD